MLALFSVDLSDPSQVSPGIAGFLTVFVLALATWLLIRSMVGHLRKVRYRAEHEPPDATSPEVTVPEVTSGPKAPEAKPPGARTSDRPS